MNIDPLGLVALALFGGIVFGLTRDRVTQPWGKWVAAGCIALGVLIAVISPPTDCHTDWDGRSNPVICD